MKCNQVCSMLSPFLDGELDGEDRSLIEMHLKTCDVCRAQVEELEEMCRALKSHLSIMASDGFDDRVMAAVPSTRVPSFLDALLDFMRPGWRQVTASVVGAVAIASLMLVSYGVKLPVTPATPYPIAGAEESSGWLTLRNRALDLDDTQPRSKSQQSLGGRCLGEEHII